MGVELAGQFSYTACESPGPYSAVPGWKVKQVLVPPGRPDLPEAVVQAAVRTFGGFRPPEIGPLATQAEIDRAPRCLRLDRLPDGHRSLAHLAAAGRDRSGRDAFFAHGLILAPGAGHRGLPTDDFGSPDRLPPTVRPADFWGADGWLAPYRAEAIERAELAAPPGLSLASPGDADRLTDFLDLHGEQLEFMLAAAERALTGGPPVVVAGMPAAVAMWTSLITHLLPPDVGWTVPFTTYETRLPDDGSVAGQFLLWGVPTDVVDAQQLPADRGTVCDPRSPAPRGSDGYRLPDGSLLPVGPWATVASAVHALGWAAEVRALIDQLPGAGGGPWPLFALPAVVLGLPSTRLDAQPGLARQAALAAATYFPTSFDLPRDLLDRVLESTVRWGESALRTTGSILRTWDGADSPPPADMADPVLATYIRELLKPGVLDREGRPWLPGSIAPSPWGRPRLIGEIPGAIGWLPEVEPPAVRAWSLLAVTDLLERLGLTAGASGHPLRGLLVGIARDFLTASVLSQALAGRQQAPPPIPTWLWQDALVDTVAAELEADPWAEPGGLLRDARLRALLDDAAGPLPRTLEPGSTLRRLTAVDCERAAAALRFPPRPELDREALGVWRAAAFLRSAVGVGRTPDPRQWPRELAAWFGSEPVDAGLLRDLIAELPDDPGGLMGLTRTALHPLPPSATTAQIVATVLTRSRMNPPLAGPLAWHRQFAAPVPFTNLSELNVPVQPDHPENELLARVARGDLSAALLPAGRDRLVRWLLVTSAHFVREWAGPDGVDRLWWSAAASGPWPTVLAERIPTVVDALRVDLAAHRRQRSAAADGLVAEWVIRSALAAGQIGVDPLAGWFTDPGAKDGWHAVARQLLRPKERSLESWTAHVRLRADRVATLGPALGDEQRQAVIDAAMGTAGTLAGTSGLFGRLRRPSAPRRG